jgi:ABC-type transport system involved in multi-copper enzyme maturation permease subunit
VIAVNPVLGREVKERFRGVRGWVMLTAYLTLLAIVLFLGYQAVAGTTDDPFSGVDATQIARAGRTIFEVLVVFMLVLVLFLVPAITSGAVAGERERQTLVPLQVTLVRPLSIIGGKLGASLAFVGLLVVASLPFLAVTYLVGGVTVTNVLVAVVMVLFTGVVVACIGTASSAVFRRVQAATVISYAAVLALSVGTFFAYGVWMLIDASRGTDTVDRAPAALLWVNPFALTGDAVTTEQSAEAGPLSALDRLILESRAREDLADASFGSETDAALVVGPGEVRPIPIDGDGTGNGDGEEPIGFDRFGNPIFPSDVPSTVPFWVESMIALSLVAGLAVWVGTRRLRTPAVTER